MVIYGDRKHLLRLLLSDDILIQAGVDDRRAWNSSNDICEWGSFSVWVRRHSHGCTTRTTSAKPATTCGTGTNAAPASAATGNPRLGSGGRQYGAERHGGAVRRMSWKGGQGADVLMGESHCLVFESEVDGWWWWWSMTQAKERQVEVVGESRRRGFVRKTWRGATGWGRGFMICLRSGEDGCVMIWKMMTKSDFGIHTRLHTRTMSANQARHMPALMCYCLPTVSISWIRCNVCNRYIPTSRVVIQYNEMLPCVYIWSPRDCTNHILPFITPWAHCKSCRQKFHVLADISIYI